MIQCCWYSSIQGGKARLHLLHTLYEVRLKYCEVLMKYCEVPIKYRRSNSEVWLKYHWSRVNYKWSITLLNSGFSTLASVPWSIVWSPEFLDSLCIFEFPYSTNRNTIHNSKSHLARIRAQEIVSSIQFHQWLAAEDLQNGHDHVWSWSSLISKNFCDRVCNLDRVTPDDVVTMQKNSWP